MSACVVEGAGKILGLNLGGFKKMQTRRWFPGRGAKPWSSVPGDVAIASGARAFDGARSPISRARATQRSCGALDPPSPRELACFDEGVVMKRNSKDIAAAIIFGLLLYFCEASAQTTCIDARSCGLKSRVHLRDGRSNVSGPSRRGTRSRGRVAVSSAAISAPRFHTSGLPPNEHHSEGRTDSRSDDS